jgi:hypothetical protein
MKKLLPALLLIAALFCGGCEIPMDFEVPIWSLFMKNDPKPQPAATPAGPNAPAPADPVVTAMPNVSPSTGNS